MAVKLPAAATMVVTCGGASFLASRTAHTPRPAAERDQRRLGPEYRAQAQRGERREGYAREVGRCRRRPSCLESVGR